MLYQAYCVRDTKTSSFSPCFFQTHDEDAKRTFVSIQRNEKSNVHQWPADFDLYRVGLFDSASGRLTSTEVPELILTGIEAKNLGGNQS